MAPQPVSTSSMALTHVLDLPDLAGLTTPTEGPCALSTLPHAHAPIGLCHMLLVLPGTAHLLHDSFVLYGPLSDAALFHVCEIADDTHRRHMLDLGIQIGSAPRLRDAAQDLADILGVRNPTLLGLVHTPAHIFAVHLGPGHSGPSGRPVADILPTRIGRFQGAWLRGPAASAHAALGQGMDLRTDIAILKHTIALVDPLLPTFCAETSVQLCVDHIRVSSPA